MTIEAGNGGTQMAHAGTPTNLAMQPTTETLNGLWRALLAAVVLFALVAGMVFVGTNVAAKHYAVPAADRSYDQIQQIRGGAILAPADRSYDQIEQVRGGTVLAPAVHYPDVSYEQNSAPTRISGTVPYSHPGQIKGHRGAMVDQ